MKMWMMLQLLTILLSFRVCRSLLRTVHPSLKALREAHLPEGCILLRQEGAMDIDATSKFI